jgi:hypothetical protein
VGLGEELVLLDAGGIDLRPPDSDDHGRYSSSVS